MKELNQYPKNIQVESDSKPHYAPDRAPDETSIDLFNSDELFLKKALDENPVRGVELLYRRYYKPLCSHVIKYVGSKAIAEDLVSEVFYDFYRTNAFEGIKTSYRYYFFRSARNRAWAYLKAEYKRSETYIERVEGVSALNQSPEDIIQFEEMYQDVQNAVDTLPVERRRIYLMNRFEGKPYREIADELNLSIKTVEVQLYRANKHIRTLLRARWLLLGLLAPIRLVWEQELLVVLTPLLN